MSGKMSQEQLTALRERLADQDGRHARPTPGAARLLLADRDHWAAEAKRLDDIADRMIRAELGAVLVAMDATGVSAEAVRATAASKAAEFVPGDRAAALRLSLSEENARLRAEVARLREVIEELHLENREGLLVIGMVHGEE